MMKKNLKHILSLLIVLVMILNMSLISLAASSTVTYQGRKNGFEFAPGSDYTKTDLFDNFKNVMPGDSLTEKIEIKNMYAGCDYIRVWLRAVLHDEDGNQISPKVLKELKARMEEDADISGVTELEYMNDFLSQLKLTVWNGDNEKPIYEGSPDALETGFEDGKVYLGMLRYKKNMTLKAKLEVPITMGNEFADRIGEVDWVFVIEERNESNGGGGGRPSSGGSGEKIEVVEPIEPQAPMLPNLPKTGDETVMWPYILLLGLGIVGMILTMFKKRKKEQ